MSRNLSFSTMVRNGPTTFFIDVVEPDKGNRYMEIVQTGPEVKNAKSAKMVIPFEAMEAFKQAVEDGVFNAANAR